MKDPFMISSIILVLAFFFILLYNNTLKNKIVNIMFLSLSLIYLILIIIFDNNYIYELLKALITYIWYPNYLLFVTTILFSIFIFIFTLLKKINLKQKILNYSLFCLNFSYYIIFLRLKIDLKSYTSYYSSNSLLVLRISSITVIIWIILSLILHIIERGNNEK
ncbi:MAG: hypothetical protein ACI4WF_03930 [Bacilli bacterium]